MSGDWQSQNGASGGQKVLGARSRVPALAHVLATVGLTFCFLEALSNPGGVLSLGWGAYPLSPILPLAAIVAWGLVTWKYVSHALGARRAEQRAAHVARRPVVEEIPRGSC